MTLTGKLKWSEREPVPTLIRPLHVGQRTNTRLSGNSLHVE